MLKPGFDTKRYVDAQAAKICERVGKFDRKLYLEFGGKLLFDYHAARVLPGYEPNAKVQILKKLEKESEVVFCVSARDIQKGRIAGTFGISYRDFTLKCIDDLRAIGLDVSTVVINLFSGESSALRLRSYLEKNGLNVYMRKVIPGYPSNLKLIASRRGFGEGRRIKTKKPIVIVTGAGPGSGKMATCLAMVYQDKENGIDSGYAKFETFPIWNLPLNHPVNMAYEAATADLKDYNLVDPHHLKAYGVKAVNYNRDVENFEVIEKILKLIISKDNFMNTYKSPTDMGVNMAKAGITSDMACREAARQEVVRRYFRHYLELIQGKEQKETVETVKKIMKKLGLKPESRKVVAPARAAMESARKEGKGSGGVFCGSAIQLSNGRIITGKNSVLLHSESSLILNAIKHLGKIPEDMHLISKPVIEEIKLLKTHILGDRYANLNVDETLVALSISSTTNPMTKFALEQLRKLRGTEMHSTHVMHKGDAGPLSKLGINMTSDGLQPVAKLYFKE